MHISSLQKPLEGIAKPKEYPTLLSPTAEEVLWAKSVKMTRTQPCALSFVVVCRHTDKQ